MLFECFYEMGERMCLGRDDSIKDQQTFKCFFCCLFAVKTEVFENDIWSALSLPGTGDITSCPY